MSSDHKGQSGAILVLTAFLLPFIILFTGLAVDVGNAYVHHSKLQNSVDAAALAGGAKYAEKQDEAATKNRIDEYMKLNQGNDSYTINKINYKKVDDTHTKITVSTSQILPTFFLGAAMKLISKDESNTDLDQWNISTKASVLVKIGSKENNPIGIFDYAMIGGHVGKANSDASWRVKKTLNFNTLNVTINGKVHSNGPIAVDQDHTVKIANLSYDANSDAELWAYYDNSSGSHHYDYNTKTWTHDSGYEHDYSETNPWGGVNWYHFRRVATLDDKDYVVQNGQAKYIDISLDKSNPLTKNLEKLIGNYIDMDDNKKLQSHVYTNITRWDYWMWRIAGFMHIPSGLQTSTTLIHGSGQNEYPGLVFEGTPGNASNYYKIIIVSGDLTVKMSNMPNFKNDDEHMLLVSLFGDVTVTDDYGQNPFYGYIYAPNGTVSLKGAGKIYGSIAADSVYVSQSGTVIEHRTFSGDSSDGDSSGDSQHVSLVSDD